MYNTGACFAPLKLLVQHICRLPIICRSMLYAKTYIRTGANSYTKKRTMIDNGRP